MGLIAIEGMQFYAHHGFHKEEQVIGGQYSVDVYMHFDFSRAAKTDDLARTVDYEQVYGIAREVMKEKARLIEHVAQRIMDETMARFPALRHIRVRVSKIHPPVQGTVERVYAELEADKDS